jgi:dual specificity phosphatase 3
MTKNETARWHRRICWVTKELALSGDLPADNEAAAVHKLEEWRRAGITHVMDTRGEWSDEALVAEVAPEIGYSWLGTHDNGGEQGDEWFDAGVTAARYVEMAPGSRLLVHCHMGVNRGPSMGLRIMLDRGWDVADAIDRIRTARPIAAVAYAEDALDHHHRHTDTPNEQRLENRRRLTQWRRDHPLDVIHVIRSIRLAS